MVICDLWGTSEDPNRTISPGDRKGFSYGLSSNQKKGNLG